MSRTKDALYDAENGRYVDAMKEEERAEYLWKHHPQSPRFRPLIDRDPPADEQPQGDE